MRLPSLTAAVLLVLTAVPADAVEEPYGWAFCTDPANRLSVSACTAHVRADCDGTTDPERCLAIHLEAWTAHDVNAAFADAVDTESRSGRLELGGLSEAIRGATPRLDRCDRSDLNCLLDDTIKRALGNHALRQTE